MASSTIKTYLSNNVYVQTDLGKDNLILGTDLYIDTEYGDSSAKIQNLRDFLDNVETHFNLIRMVEEESV